MTAENCTWVNIFSEKEKESLAYGFCITGSISVALGIWLNWSLLKIRNDLSYMNLTNFTLAACTRRIAAAIAIIPFINRQWLLREYRADIAFVETFLAVFEIELLTHVCIERYVIAKYATQGWVLNPNQYKLYKLLSVFFAFIYSIPPFIGIGKYDFDFSCTFSTFDMTLPHCWERYFIVSVFVLRSVKPTAFMITKLIRATRLESKLSQQSQNDHRRTNFTRNVVTITIVNLCCWLPIALVRAEVVIYQLLYNYPYVPVPPAFFIKWAMWIHWVSPGLTAVVLFLNDEQIREKMLPKKIVAKSEANEGGKKKMPVADKDK